jgi:cysteine desulfurase/selenocysteine lyase
MKNIKSQFPIFQTHPDLVYLDSAATTQTPQVVVDAMNEYYTQYRANIHRGFYDISARATDEYENAREKIANFIGAERNEIIFTSGTTHGLNFLARSLCKNLKAGDNIVLTQLEHHANLVPWQEYAREKGIELRFIEIATPSLPPGADKRNDRPYELDVESVKNLIDKNTKIVSLSLVSNVLGTITIASIPEIFEWAKKVGAITVVDAAQAMVHMGPDVKVLDCDFLVFSGHKMYGPTGIGVLYGKKERLENLEPFFYGGDMVREVTFEKSSWADIPERFEGGTANIAGAIGLGAAVDFIQSIGLLNIIDHEARLQEKLFEELKKIDGLKIIGPEFGEPRVAVVSFTLEGVHPHDIAEILNRDQVCIRVGHHCAMPLMKHLGLPGTARVSLGIYNTVEDIEKFVEAIKKVKSIFNLSFRA